MSDTKKKTAITFYLRPEFILMVLTALLWLAFLVKVFIQAKDPATAENNSNKVSSKITNDVFQTKSPDNQDNNPLQNKQLHPEETEIEALRESLDKVKPADNLIIRGKTMRVTQTNGRNKMPAAELIINQENLKNINADYKNALKTAR